MLRSGVILLVLGIAVFLAASVQLFQGQDEESPLVHIVRAGDAACGKRHLERKPLF